MNLKLPTAARSRVVSSIIEAALSPHPVDRYLELIDPMLTWRDMRAKVIGVERRTDRSVTLTLSPSGNWTGHRAGQYVQVSVVIDGVRHTRCFSPANAANDGSSAIELTVTAHPDGFVSRHLRDHTAVGDVVGLAPAAGDFTLPDHSGELVFVSGGSGITPVLSMLRTLIASGHRDSITFVHYARTPDDLPYRHELRTLAAAYPHIDLRLHFTEADDPAQRSDFFTAGHLDGAAGLDRGAHLFLCGPPPLMDDVKRFCADRGITDRLHFEAFTVATPAVATDEATGELRFIKSGRAAANDGRTILEQAEAAGLSPDSGCRMGICFSCTAIKKSGCTRNVLTGETDTDADQHIQLCINRPVGDVEIEV